MKKRIAVVIAAIGLSAGLLPGTALAGQYCEQLDRAGGGDACRAAVGAGLTACNKVAALFDNECGLG